MKKIILGLMVLNSLVFADKRDELFKKQCLFLVYGKGEHNLIINTYLGGVVDGQIYASPINKRSEIARISPFQDIIKLGCKFAFKDKSNSAFVTKYKLAVNDIILKGKK